MTSDLDILKAALAAGPTPGPWVEDRRLGWVHPNTVVQAEHQKDTYRSVMDVHLSDIGSFSCTTGKAEQEGVNAAYIAACSPDRIARLVTEVERKDAALRELVAASAYNEWTGHANERLVRARNAARAVIAVHEAKR